MTGEPAAENDILLSVSAEAADLLREIERERDGGVVVMLNDGCCDGMGPVAVDADTVGVNDAHIGSARGIDVHAPPTRESIRAGYEIHIDVTEAEGVGAFSLEVPRGYRLTATEHRGG